MGRICGGSFILYKQIISIITNEFSTKIKCACFQAYTEHSVMATSQWSALCYWFRICPAWHWTTIFSDRNPKIHQRKNHAGWILNGCKPISTSNEELYMWPNIELGHELSVWQSGTLPERIMVPKHWNVTTQFQAGHTAAMLKHLRLVKTHKWHD